MKTKIGLVLGKFRSKCSSCMWNKEVENNENCKTCITENTKYILSLFGRIEKLKVGGANGDIPTDYGVAIKINEIIDLLNKANFHKEGQ